MAKDTRWDRSLSVTSDAEGLIGHAGAVLLRKLADQCGLTPALGAITLGARSMSDITVLAHQEPVLGAAPSDTTVRRTLELADPATLDKLARARAAVRAHVWSLICARPAGFPWLAIAGKLLAGWLVIDLDATLITAQRQRRSRAHVQDGLRLPTRWGPGWPAPAASNRACGSPALPMRHCRAGDGPPGIQRAAAPGGSSAAGGTCTLVSSAPSSE